MHAGQVTAFPPIRVLLVDDHPAVREGLALLLAPEGVDVCAEAGGRADALARLEERRPDLAMVDLSLDGEDGLVLVADLRRRAVPVLIYSMHSDTPSVESAFAAGALGYVTKREFHGVLVQAIREVAAGRRFVSPKAAVALAESLGGPPDGDGAGRLSSQERKVYELLGQGEDTFDIAAALGISPRTVESYYERTLVKLGLNGMHDLRRRAIEAMRRRGPQPRPRRSV